MKKPTIEQIQEYLKTYNPLNLNGAFVELFSEHNHLNYRLEKDNKVYYLRMINPETYRAGEWMRMSEEYTLLKYLEKTDLGPEAYYVDPERFPLPLLIGEFVTDATCFNDLKPLSKEHLAAAARAIAELNSQNITPDNFPFGQRRTHYSYLSHIIAWQERLNFLKKSKNPSVLNWLPKIEEITERAKETLKKFEPLLKEADYVFNFDGAHCGNTYWRNNQVMFLDWQSVSYGDPAFTLARFLTSVPSKVTDNDKEMMVQEYLNKKDVPDFAKLLDQRLFEREISDLIWVVWHFEKSGNKGEIDINERYQSVLNLL